MQRGHGEQREAHADAVSTVSSRPVIPSDNAATSSEPPTISPSVGGPPLPPHPKRRLSMMAALVGCVLIVLVITLFADAGHTTAGRAHAVPTATPSPTATVIPSPTAMVGFRVYTDLPDSFVLQYPDNWTLDPIKPNGVVFSDSASNTSYFMQLLVPSDGTAPGSAGSADDASAWVQYAIDQLATVPGTLQQETGPIPARVIGGETWQSGIARISQGATVIRVQVYATVHDGKPYIINVAAVDDRFTAGAEEFFDPMLRSFQFLPPSP